jgi:hypothetical protein
MVLVYGGHVPGIIVVEDYSKNVLVWLLFDFITCQDQSRFCEKPSQNHIWDKRVEKNPTKTLDNLVIYRLNIIETDFILG